MIADVSGRTRRTGLPGRRIAAAIAGDSVSAINAEMTTAAETAIANWAKSTPDAPGRNATGTKTASNTKVMAMIDGTISVIARRVAAAAERAGASSMTRSTFSTTMIASSTTMPIASTSASSVMAFADAPRTKSTPTAPMIATGAATSGITAALMRPRKRKTTSETSANAMRSVSTTLWSITSMKSAPSRILVDAIPAGKRSASLPISASTADATRTAFASGAR